MVVSRLPSIDRAARRCPQLLYCALSGAQQLIQFDLALRERVLAQFELRFQP